MTKPPSLYTATVAGRLETYNAYIAAGHGTPFIYPWDTLPALYLLLGLVLRPYLRPQLARASGYVALLLIVVHSAHIVLYRRCLGFAGGYGIGLVALWGTIMTVVLLIVHEPEKDFARLEIYEAGTATTYTQTAEGVSYSVGKENSSNQVTNRTGKSSTQTFQPKKSKQNRVAVPYRLVWQSFPQDLAERIDWSIDLMTSFRGPNWNFRIPTLPKLKTLPPPPGLKTTKAIESSILANETDNPSDPALSMAVFRKSIFSTIRWYILVDIIKVIMISDPYFLGLRPVNSVSPWPYIQGNAFLTKLARLLVSLAGVQIWLSLVFSLSPLFFYIVLPYFVPQSTLIKYTRSPLYDPRMYTKLYSPAYPAISTKGLAGFWGRYWHQMFRFGISEPSIPIIKLLNLNPRSQLARAIQLLIAFGLTGAIHFAASATTFSIIPSKPSHAFSFFFLQGIGILAQTAIAKVLVKQVKLESIALRKLGNIAFVLVWLWFTGPLLSNDFARAGIWLFEPVPVSFTRGVLGRGWWVWKGQFLGWWSGTAWWNSGIAIL